MMEENKTSVTNRRKNNNNHKCRKENALSNTPVGEHDPLLPYLQTSLLPNVVESLLTDGYAVLPSILTKEECESAMNLLWNFVEDVSSSRVSRSDPTSWYPRPKSINDDGSVVFEEDPWPHTGYSSFPDMFQSHGAGFLLGHVRELLAERVFEPLYSTKKLHASKEGFTFHRPSLVQLPSSSSPSSPSSPSQQQILQHHLVKEENNFKVCGKIQSKSHREHYDQAHSKYGLHSIQSSIAFLDQEKDKDGCFLCYPKSHSRIHHELTKNTYRGQFDWIPLTNDEITSLSSLQEHQIQPKCIPVKAGDVILWRSDLVHAALSPKHNTITNFRAVGYVSMIPSIFTLMHSNDPYHEEKIKAYRYIQTGDHNAHCEDNWHVHKRNQKHNSDSTNDASFLRPYFRFGPPKVSWRLAQLYGLVPYRDIDDEDEEWKEKERLRAIVRGVVFDDECHSTMSIATPITNPPLEKSILPTPPPPPPPPKRGIPCPARVEILRLDSDLPLLGQEKYLGGVGSPCGTYIYGVCGHAKRTLRVQCDTGVVDMIGPEYHGQFKWLRGVEIPADAMKNESDYLDENNNNNNNNGDNQSKTTTTTSYPKGLCLALPCNADAILKINPHTNEVSTFGGPFQGGWKWHGGNLALNGMVYAIPANTNRVLKINPQTEETFLIGPDFGFQKQKWFGGIFAKTNGCIYGIPHNANGVLKIDPETDECVILGQGQLHEGQWKWHGGLANLDGSKIYGFPNNTDEVLVIDTLKDDFYTVSNPDFPLKSGRHRCDDKYKYLGGALTSDGTYAYLFPCDAERVLRIDTKTDTLKLVGPELLEGQNKYQNGFAGKDGCVYAIPQCASSVLRIDPPGSRTNDTEEDMIEMLYCGDEMVAYKDKFEGGVMGGKDGAIYCMPLRAKAVLRVLLPDITG